jgi:hypothetical protein
MDASDLTEVTRWWNTELDHGGFVFSEEQVAEIFRKTVKGREPWLSRMAVKRRTREEIARMARGIRRVRDEGIDFEELVRQQKARPEVQRWMAQVRATVNASLAQKD